MASTETQDMIGNIQFYYSCREATDRHREECLIGCGSEAILKDSTESMSNDEDLGFGEDLDCGTYFTEEGLQELLKQKGPIKEISHGQAAVMVGHTTGMFREHLTKGEIQMKASAFQSEDMQRLAYWKSCLDYDSHTISNKIEDYEEKGGVDSLDMMCNPNDSGVVSSLEQFVTRPSSNHIDTSCLKEDQQCAYFIITSHLQDFLHGLEWPPLLMQLIGEGGTGKSKVIQVVTDTFAALDASQLLIKGAYTGIAACVIGSATLHSLCGIPVNGGKPSVATITKLVMAWKNVKYFIIDEYSMLSRALLGCISTILSIVYDKIRGRTDELPFGGISVILCGDFHQFPPVCATASSPLYWPVSGRVQDRERTRRPGACGAPTYLQGATQGEQVPAG